MAPPSTVRWRPTDGLNAHALFGSVGWTTRLTTPNNGPLTFDHVAPLSVLRKTPPELPAQITAGLLGATTTAFTAPPAGPDELQPANEVDAMKRRAKRGKRVMISK